MSSFSTKILSKNSIINLLFSSLIVSFIAGNLVLNLNVLLIIVASIIFYKEEIFIIDFDLFDKILIFLFVYILICGLVNSLNYYRSEFDNDFTVLKKSIFFLRFLIFFFIIKFLIKKNIINFKFFFYISSAGVIFVCADIIYQLIFGYDIFGYDIDPDPKKAAGRRLSGPFGDELIAGSFIQRFSLISLFSVTIFFKFKKSYVKYFLTMSLILLFITSLVLSGNRIPLIFFVITIICLIIFENNLRKFLIPFILIVFTIIFSIYNLNNDVRNHFHGFSKKLVQILLPLSKKHLLTNEEEEEYKNYQFYTFEYNGKKYKITNSHLKEFKTGYVTWLDKKIFGGGVKSFKINCPKAKTINCSSHPHNYYLEILSSLGLFGFMIIFILFILLFLRSFVTKYFKNSHLNNFNLITPFIFLFFAEIFPIKSTGSFFSTGNATYIFLILSILISLIQYKNKIE